MSASPGLSGICRCIAMICSALNRFPLAISGCSDPDRLRHLASGRDGDEWWAGPLTHAEQQDGVSFSDQAVEVASGGVGIMPRSVLNTPHRSPGPELIRACAGGISQAPAAASIVSMPTRKVGSRTGATRASGSTEVRSGARPSRPRHTFRVSAADEPEHRRHVPGPGEDREILARRRETRSLHLLVAPALFQGSCHPFPSRPRRSPSGEMRPMVNVGGFGRLTSSLRPLTMRLIADSTRVPHLIVEGANVKPEQRLRPG